MPNANDVELYTTKCGYCKNDITINPPYNSKIGGEFWSLCPNDMCRQPIKFYFINGRITSKESPILFEHSNELMSKGDIHREIAQLMDEGCLNAYYEKYRGAAITFRCAAELFVAHMLGEDTTRDDIPSIKEALINLAGQHPNARLTTADLERIIERLKFVKDLGVNAAHPRVCDRDVRKLAVEKSTVSDAKMMFEESLSIYHGL
jgi:hypothetical protein